MNFCCDAFFPLILDDSSSDEDYTHKKLDEYMDDLLEATSGSTISSIQKS